MDKNDPDKIDKLTATKDKPHPVSPRDQKGPDHPQNSRVGTIKRGSGFFGYDKETKKYASDERGNEQLTKITREYQPGKTFWDWMQLLAVLAIPVVVALVSVPFSMQQNASNQQQHKVDLQIAQENRANDIMIANDQQQEATLQTYLDDMSNLLLNNKLLESKPGDVVRQVARERTLTTLRRLKADRNRIVLQFLQDAHLIGIQDAVIDLSNADLSNDDLSGANLSGTDLSSVKLSGAKLSGATLISTILNSADLNSADLRNAHLNGARNLTQKQLDKVLSCTNAILSTGLTCHHNQ